MRIRPLLLLAALLVTMNVSAAKSPREALVVTTSWLAAHLADPDLVLLHVGDKAEYEAAHLPGARFVTLNDIANSDRTEKGLVLEMPAADDLHARLEKLGISDKSRVVVYYGKDWVSPTTRVIFTLDYAGLGDRAAILDGGMDAWKRDGREVTAVVPPPRAGKLAPLKIHPMIVDAAYVRAHLATRGIKVVDGRASAFYDGIDTGGMAPQLHRTGHITGAGSFPFTEVTDENLMLRSPEELRAMLAKAGVKPGDTVLGYCHIGQQVTAVLFVARTLGHKVLLYDGAMQDWSRHPDYPVENPAKVAR
jgi:thiosulfate/3-mercaptopyruvate sulfurtransferase